MAGRTSSSVGVGVGFAILGLLCLTLFVLTFLYFSRYNDARVQVAQLQQESTDVLTSAERTRDDIRTLMAAAKADRKSLVAFLADDRGAIMERVTGSRRDTLESLGQKLGSVDGAGTTALVEVIKAKEAEIVSLQQQLALANEQRANIEAALQNAAAQGAEQRASHERALASALAEIGQYKSEVDRFRTETDEYKARVARQLDEAQAAAAENQSRLEQQVARLNETNLIQANQISALRGERTEDLLKSQDEAALVDGSIIAVTGASEAFINLGREQRVTLGMSFAVYSDARAIRGVNGNELARPKATVEVISINESTATVRITSSSRGNPVVRGDVLVNAVYDPKKQYRFVVFGNFETDGDGIPTSAERAEIDAMIRGWGGRVESEVSGNTDFIVLGDRPVLPPQPGSGAPFEVVQEFLRRQQEVDRYDALFRQAGESGIPVLNQNRLSTLTGR